MPPGHDIITITIIIIDLRTRVRRRRRTIFFFFVFIILYITIPLCVRVRPRLVWPLYAHLYRGRMSFVFYAAILKQQKKKTKRSRTFTYVPSLLNLKCGDDIVVVTCKEHMRGRPNSIFANTIYYYNFFFLIFALVGLTQIGERLCRSLQKLSKIVIIK